MEKVRNVLRAFAGSCDVREDAEPPFDAEAVFRSREEGYVLVRSARISECESNEFIFFRGVGRLGAEELRSLCAAAWERGLSRVRPHFSHRNTDVSLVVVADSATGDALRLVRKIRLSKTYCLTLKGWSDFKLAVLDLSSGLVASNGRGRALAEAVGKSSDGFGGVRTDSNGSEIKSSL